MTALGVREIRARWALLVGDPEPDLAQRPGYRARCPRCSRRHERQDSAVCYVCDRSRSCADCGTPLPPVAAQAGHPRRFCRPCARVRKNARTRLSMRALRKARRDA